MDHMMGSAGRVSRDAFRRGRKNLAAVAVPGAVFVGLAATAIGIDLALAFLMDMFG